MDKDITKYLHYYLGQDCEITAPDGIPYEGTEKINFHWIERVERHGGKIKPRLRKLESMTEEEMKELLVKRYHPNEDIFLSTFDSVLFFTKELKRDIKRGIGVGYTCIKNNKGIEMGTLSFTNLYPAQFHYLLSRGFWLFGNDWFDEGLIIDKNTLKG